MSQFVFAVGVCAADLGYELSARVYAYECVFCCVCLFLSEPYCLRAWFSHWEGTAVAVHYRERETVGVWSSAGFVYGSGPSLTRSSASC